MRFNEADHAFLDALQERLGLSRTDVIRLSVRRLAEIEGVKLPEKPKAKRRTTAA